MIIENAAGLAVFKPSPWDRVVARLRAPTLDSQLAGGCPPDDNWLRAVRAAMLVAPQSREQLARNWENLLDRACRPHGAADPRALRLATDPRVPLPRARIAAAENDIRQLVVALRASRPVPVRGVAMANLLLMDGTGPVYSLRCQLDLGTAVRDATRHLDPWTMLMEPSLD